jgi:hypothetical protein
MERSVHAIVVRHGPRYLRARTVRPAARRAVQALMRCGTAELGGHVKRCEAGHVLGIWYNGCGHRSCPRCGRRRAPRWAGEREQQLLPADHFHVVFTWPSELRVLWPGNRRQLGHAFFAAVSQTLLTLLRDPRQGGVTPGISLALHTWSRSLMLHPHIHALVSGGGADAAGQWRACRNGFLLPSRMMAQVYRGKLLSELEGLVRGGRLRAPAFMDTAGMLRVLRRAARAKWHVWVAERYPHGRGVMGYLSHYVRGGPIGDSRLLSVEESAVTFRLRGESRLTLPVGEFLGRFLQHVPERQERVVRHYGLYAPGKREQLELCRAQLVAAGAPAPPPRPEPAPVPWEPAAGETCRHCGGVVYAEVIPRGGAPPALRDWLAENAA